MKKILLVTILISFVSLPLSVSAAKSQSVDDLSTIELLDLFGDVFQKIREDYVEEVTDKELIESAINGMLTDLDPHSSFLNFDDFKDMKEQTKGEFGGLGIEVTMKNGLVYIVAPLDDTPAAEAGLEAGDYISHIDGEAVFGMTIGEAVKKMRGKPKTDIVVKIIRDGMDKPFDVTVTRDIITVKSVKSEIHEDVGYLRITSFTENSSSGIEEEVARIKEELGDDLKGFVLDLRNNPGGLLTEAVSVADAFLNKGEVVSTRGRNNVDAQKFSASYGDIIDGLPLVVLINSGSASASEIVSGALQDHRRAVIVGEKSFGKGSVQTVIPLPSNTAIRLTTSRYYTPSGTSIQAEGITPDIIVEPAELKLSEKLERTKEANLRGHLESDSKKEIDEDKLKEIIKSSIKDTDKEIDEDMKKTLFDDEDGIYSKDYQLGRAIDMVRALAIYEAKE